MFIYLLKSDMIPHLIIQLLPTSTSWFVCPVTACTRYTVMCIGIAERNSIHPAELENAFIDFSVTTTFTWRGAHPVARCSCSQLWPLQAGNECLSILLTNPFTAVPVFWLVSWVSASTASCSAGLQLII